MLSCPPSLQHSMHPLASNNPIVDTSDNIYPQRSTSVNDKIRNTFSIIASSKEAPDILCIAELEQFCKIYPC